MVAAISGKEPLVVRNDEMELRELDKLVFDQVIISPGPGRPEYSQDVGLSADVLKHANVPVFGICLGHQALAHAYGGVITHAPEIYHGRLSALQHDGAGLFHDVPQYIQVVRYHSLVVAEPLPAALEATAWTREGILMGLRHREKPLWSVQFHPESVCTEQGERLFRNFERLALRYYEKTGLTLPSHDAAAKGALRFSLAQKELYVTHTEASEPPAEANESDKEAEGALCVMYRKLGSYCDAEAVFMRYYAEQPYAFWLDSSRSDGELARFSYIGACCERGGSLGEVLRYDAGEGLLERLSFDGHIQVRETVHEKVHEKAHEKVHESVHESVFDLLKKQLAFRKAASCPSASELPFEFQGGYVGYLGYELKQECGGGPGHASELPDALFLFADQIVVFDHAERQTYLVALAAVDDQEKANGWLASFGEQLIAMARAEKRAAEQAKRVEAEQVEPERVEPERVEPAGQARQADQAAQVEQTGQVGQADQLEKLQLQGQKESTQGSLAFTMARSHKEYIADLERVKHYLIDGESYEVNLTNRIYCEPLADLLQTYCVLRRINPAPYAAYLRLGEAAVLCSSPERFLHIGADKRAEAKPIKGTQARGATVEEDERRKRQLQASGKDFSENLMIVDLLRNDLGRVCEPGSVHVPELMQVETYETVHQLVTTIRGKLKADVTAVDALRAAFPPGSMTGAPKIRTMAIIDELEQQPRGIYSGALGYLSVTGAASFNVVIRTIVATPERTTIGVGGGVTIQSDAQGEYEEMLLKAEALLRAIAISEMGKEQTERYAIQGDRLS